MYDMVGSRHLTAPYTAVAVHFAVRVRFARTITAIGDRGVRINSG